MKLRVGYELQYDFPQPTPVIAMLNIHFTRVSDLAMPDHIVVSPSLPISVTVTVSAIGAAGCSPRRGGCACPPTLS